MQMYEYSSIDDTCNIDICIMITIETWMHGWTTYAYLMMSLLSLNTIILFLLATCQIFILTDIRHMETKKSYTHIKSKIRRDIHEANIIQWGSVM